MCVLKSTQNTVTPPLGWRGPCAFRQSAAHSHPAFSWSCGERHPCVLHAFFLKKKKQTKGLEKSQWPGRLAEYWNYWPCPVLCWLALQFHRSLYSSPVGKKPFKPGREGGPPSLGSLGCPGCFIGTPPDNWYLRLPPALGSEESCSLHRATRTFPLPLFRWFHQGVVRGGNSGGLLPTLYFII